MNQKVKQKFYQIKQHHRDDKFYKNYKIKEPNSKVHVTIIKHIHSINSCYYHYYFKKKKKKKKRNLR